MSNALRLRVLAGAALVVIGIVAFGERLVGHRLVVVFGSHCCGPNRDAIAGLNRLIDDFEAKYQRVLAREIISWGIEGDHTYCFRLSRLSGADRRKFVSEVHKLAGSKGNSGGWTKVLEYAPCAGHGAVHSIKHIE